MFCFLKLCNWKVISENKNRVLDTYYVNNNYTDVTKVHEDYVEFRTSKKQKNKKLGKTKKLVLQKNR